MFYVIGNTELAKLNAEGIPEYTAENFILLGKSETQAGAVGLVNFEISKWCKEQAVRHVLIVDSSTGLTVEEHFVYQWLVRAFYPSHKAKTGKLGQRRPRQIRNGRVPGTYSIRMLPPDPSLAKLVPCKFKKPRLYPAAQQYVQGL